MLSAFLSQFQQEAEIKTKTKDNNLNEVLDKNNNNSSKSDNSKSSLQKKQKQNSQELAFSKQKNDNVINLLFQQNNASSLTSQPQSQSYIQVKFISIKLQKDTVLTFQNQNSANPFQISFLITGQKWIYKMKLEEQSNSHHIQQRFISNLDVKHQNQIYDQKFHYFKFNQEDKHNELLLFVKKLNLQVVVPLKNFISYPDTLHQIEADLYDKRPQNDTKNQNSSIGKLKFSVLFVRNIWLQVQIKAKQLISDKKPSSNLFMKIIKQQASKQKPLNKIYSITDCSQKLKLSLTNFEFYTLQFGLEQQNLRQNTYDSVKLNMNCLQLLSNTNKHIKRINLNESMQDCQKVFELFYECKIIKQQIDELVQDL